MKEYDNAEIVPGNTFIDGVDWQICFCSSLKRAVDTARHIYRREIIITDLLREVSLSPFTDREIKLPWFVWHVGARIAWARNSKSQEETRADTYERIKKIYSQIIDSGNDNILIISHGFFMKCFAKFLIENQFKGFIDKIPRNGRLYIFENLSRS
jgi:broad specificity phosphatase PhoE